MWSAAPPLSLPSASAADAGSLDDSHASDDDGSYEKGPFSDGEGSETPSDENWGWSDDEGEDEGEGVLVEGAGSAEGLDPALLAEAEDGEARAQFTVGEHYNLDVPGLVDESFPQAVEWYRRAGDHEARARGAYELGRRCERGQGVPVDLTQAAHWYHKAAEQGDAHGQHALGKCLLRGEGAPADPQGALRWLRKAADNACTEAQCQLALCYKDGLSLAEEGPEDSARWWLAAADDGSIAAQFVMGERCARGDGMPQDLEAAVGWYRKAAEEGYGAEHSPNEPSTDCGVARWAQLRLGACYEEGRGVPMDLEEGARWYRKAADGALPEGWHALGRLLHAGAVPGGPHAAAQAFLKAKPRAGEAGGGDAHEGQRLNAIAELAADPAVARGVCFGCGALASEKKLITCKGCMTARFCGKECLRAAWRPHHKAHCAALARRGAEAGPLT